MPSKTSFFNRGIASNILRRFWPLWAVYLAFLLLIFPQALANDLDSIHEGRLLFMDYHAVNIGITMVYISFGVAVLTAMAMFHYLYQAKSCSMVNALPIRRETMFWTAYLTGIVPLLAADLIAVLLCALFYSTRGYLHLSALGDVLFLLVFGNIMFYGFAVFCAMLTGNLLVLPAVYAVLLFTAFVAEWAGHYLLSRFVFGMSQGTGGHLVFLSPLVKLSQSIVCRTVGDKGSYELLGKGTVAAYGAAGIMLSAASLFLYRYRQMETATDVVAIRILKPVFKYCLCFGMALVFASLVFSNFFDSRITGLSAAGLILLLMLIGGFIGYFAAEMLIQKTLKVFSGQWRGFLAACVVIVLFVGIAEFDVFRFEKRVPPEDNVQTVYLYSAGYSAELSEPEEIAAAEVLHRAVIADKEACDRFIGTDLRITYMLQNGKTITREYTLPLETRLNPDSFQRQAEALLNRPSAILARVSFDVPFDRQHFRFAAVSYCYRTENDMEPIRNEQQDLTFEESESLYLEGILPDAEAGTIGLAHLVQDEAYYDNTYVGGIDFYFASDPDYMYSRIMNITIETASENTLRWLQEHTDLTLQTYTELGLDEPVF